MNQYDSFDTMALAANYAYLNDSAMLCLNDALHCYKLEDYDATHKRALDSLKHSVGIFHTSYQKASK